MMNPGAKELILPAVFPSTASYPAETYLFCILMNYPQSHDWIYERFINLYGYITEENYLYQAYTFDEIRKICPFVSFSQFKTRDFIEDHFDGLAQFLKACITSGYYIILQYDQYFLHHTMNYKRNHNAHDLFIYGFNDLSKKFYVADFFQHSKFSFEEVSFSELEEAVENVSADKYRIDMLKFKNADYSFNCTLLLKELNDFLNSTRSVFDYEENALSPAEINRLARGGFTFGAANYDLINTLLSQVIEGSRHREIPEAVFRRIFFRIRRATHVLYAHKVLMIERLNFLEKRGIIRDFEAITGYKHLIDLCQISRNMFIRYELTLNAGIIEKLIRNYENVKIQEKSILQRLVNQLSDGCTIKEG